MSRAAILCRGMPAAGVAAGWTYSAVVGAHWLAINRVTVGGNARLSTGEVAALIDNMRGKNILLVDLETYRNQLLDSPWVATATLRRVLPSTVEVRITERAPWALARLGQQIYLVDGTGLIIDEFGPQYRDMD